jgi:hypothetical protein
MHRRLASIAVAVLLGLATQPFGNTPLHAVPSNVLFVTGSTTLSAADTAVKNRLEATGYVVEVRPQSSSSLGNVTGKTLVVISSSGL